jgi:DNA-binding NarL/FixJ family response regulator
VITPPLRAMLTRRTEFLLAAMHDGGRAAILSQMRQGCLIVDDNASFLEASRTLLERQGLTVIGVASSAAEGLRRAAELKPEVILIDIDLGEDSGFDLARELAQTAHDIPANLILISTHREEDFADLIAESPALGFIAKSDLSKHAIQQILDNRLNKA